MQVSSVPRDAAAAASVAPTASGLGAGWSGVSVFSEGRLSRSVIASILTQRRGMEPQARG